MSGPPSSPPGLDQEPTTLVGLFPPPNSGAFSLENILGENPDAVEHPGVLEHQASATGWDQEETERPVLEGFCVECEGTLSILNLEPR